MIIDISLHEAGLDRSRVSAQTAPQLRREKMPPRKGGSHFRNRPNQAASCVAQLESQPLTQGAPNLRQTGLDGFDVFDMISDAAIGDQAGDISIPAVFLHFVRAL